MRKKIAVITVAWLATIIIAPFIGKISIDPFHLDLFHRKILLTLRVPRTLVGMVAGGNLAIAGFLLQTILVNPLATPYTLGISSGASLGFIITLLLGGSFAMGSFTAFVGGMTGVIIAYLLALQKKIMDRNTLIIAGITVSVIFSSVILFLYYISPGGKVIEIIHWLMGNIYPESYDLLSVIYAISILIIAGLILISREINILSLGREEAITLGVNFGLFLAATVAGATLLTSIIVSITGPIGFAGLIVPHILRGWGIRKSEFAIPLNFMGGGILIVWSDTLSRVILSSGEIPVGILTAFLGGIFLLWILKKASPVGLA